MSPALAEVRPNSAGRLEAPVPSLYSALRRVAPWSMALDNWSARMIRTIDGGMIWPSVPDAAMVPVASDFE